MQQRQVDVAIIGAGTAGLTARRAAEKEGADAVMIDPGPYGTTCARVGCMPSKLLIAAADAAWHARHAGIFGVDAEVRVDGPRVMQRVRAERDRFVGFVVDAIDGHLQATRLIRGRARFLEPRLLQVDDHTSLDAAVHWSLGDAWRLRLRLENLLDERFETRIGFPGAGRSFRLSLRWSPT